MLRLLNQFLAVLVAVAMAVLVLEGFLRVLGWAPAPRMHRFDPVVGWVKVPGADIRRRTGEFDVRVRTNALGLRGPETWSYERRGGVVRVLMVGDSFTLGYTVPEAASIPFLVETGLAESGIAAEVLNAGTEGWSTDQEVLWLATEGRRYQPDVVVLQVYENDIFWNSRTEYLRYPKPRIPDQGQGRWDPESAAAGAALIDPGRDSWWLRTTAIGGVIAGWRTGPAMPLLDDGSGLPAEWGARLEGNEVGRGETRAALQAFAALSAAMGAQPLVLVIPDKAQVDADSLRAVEGFMGSDVYRPNRPYEFLVTAARSAGLPVVGGLSVLRAAQSAGPVYFARDWHTNAAGNQALAGALATRLLAPEFLGGRGSGGAPTASIQDNIPRDGPVGSPPGWLWAILVWFALGTLFRRRFPDSGLGGSYGAVACLLLCVVSVLAGGSWLVGLLPLRVQSVVPLLVLTAVLILAGFYLRGRLSVMLELFLAFVRRGHWYMLPVLVALLAVGGLLVVAASSPWLAPFIYTLF